MVDYFHILGITSTSSDAEVKRRYYAEAKMWHPDHNSSPEASARFKLINAAYQALQTSKKRQEYQFEISPDTYEDDGGSWHQRGRSGRSKWQEDMDQLYRQQYNDVNYEFNQAEQKWQNKHANSKTVKFYKFWEKVIAPRNLFFFIPLGIATYYVGKSTIKHFILPESAGTGSDCSKATLGGASSFSSSGPATSSSGGGSVRAWLNPATQQWETPAPWDPLFKARDVQLVHRSKVQESKR